MRMFYDNGRTCRLPVGTIIFKSAHPPTRVPPTRKDSDALSSHHLSYALKKPTVHYLRGHRLVIESSIDWYYIITASGRTRGLRLKGIDMWELCASENKKGDLCS